MLATLFPHSTISDAQTAALAAKAARLVSPGETLALSGPVGMGKTAFTRGLIQALAGTQIDVPSPTFPIVQTYELPWGEVWHVDLYRVSHVQELDDLGLTDALDTAFCIVEWPELLLSLPRLTAHHLTLTAPDPTTRRFEYNLHHSAAMRGAR
ncbi:MAG: tRNA (adenosine(37)-N6)-threonylcarbamoyltransferase complex ATPase subunit type 1 TsaE [Shimia sp.]